MSRPLCEACRWAEADAKDPFGPFHAIDALPLNAAERYGLFDARNEAERALAAINACAPFQAIRHLARALAALRRLPRIACTAWQRTVR